MMPGRLKSALRNLRANVTFSLINLIGLSMGLASFALLFFYSYHELSYDTHHTKSARIFRIVQAGIPPHNHRHIAQTSLPLAQAIKDQIPEVEYSVNIVGGMPSWVHAGNTEILESDHYLTTQDFFNVFDVTFLVGEEGSALLAPYSVVLTESSALKHFGNTDVLGQTLLIERYGKFQVTGVIADVPSNSTLQFSMLLSQEFDHYLTTVHPNFANRFATWNTRVASTYLTLGNEDQKTIFEEKLAALLVRFKPADWIPNRYYLQGIEQQHLYSSHIQSFITRDQRQGDLTSIYILQSIGIFMLMLACANYTNLATSQSTTRAKEIAMKRMLGATKGHLRWQLLIESTLLALLSVPLALGLFSLAMPKFRELSGIVIQPNSEQFMTVTVITLFTALAVGILSGLYPAFFLTRFKSIIQRRHEELSTKTSVVLRNTLVIFQFSLSIVLIVAVAVVTQQLEYVHKKELGIDQQGQVVVEINGGGVRNNFSTIKNALLAHSDIQYVTGCTRAINGYRTPPLINIQKGARPDSTVVASFYGIDEDGVPALGLEIIAGQNFQGNANDQYSILLNEKAAQLLGESGTPGNHLTLSDDEVNLNVTITGIVRDFHFRSLHEPIAPMVIGYIDNPFQGIDDIMIRVNPNNTDDAIAHIEAVHNRYDENKVMTWDFLDQMTRRFYHKTMTFKQIYLVASLAAIFIATLGLMGLAAFMATKRTKEFSIRKVLGSSTLGILKIQYKQFISLIVCSMILAVPIAYRLMDYWLSGYAYKTVLGFQPFLLACFLVSFVTLITVFGVGCKVAMTNPVKYLRHE